MIRNVERGKNLQHARASNSWASVATWASRWLHVSWIGCGSGTLSGEMGGESDDPRIGRALFWSFRLCFCGDVVSKKTIKMAFMVKRTVF